MGRHLEADGIARIGGRLLGFLLLQEEPRSLDELAQGLRVSKTSVSTNARLLEEWGLIQRVTRPGDRRDYYEAAADQTRTLEMKLRRIRERIQLLEEGAAALPHDRPHASERLDQMHRFNLDVVDCLHSVLERWRTDWRSAG